MPKSNAQNLERGQATRDRLLAAAAALIGEAGWGAVSTRMAADRAGVAPGVVHYHFGSVTDLLVTASTTLARDLVESVGAGLEAQLDLGAGIDWLAAQLAAHPPDDPASRLVAEMYLASSRTPELREQLALLLDGFRARAAAWLAARGYAGDPAPAAALLAAVVDGVMLHRGLDPGLDPRGLTAPLRAMVGAQP
ncbi:TetR/AcrR family transcriptional regulator [Nonomuraea sp. NPDC050310]|uniref:TetR/AcrR family transcriptional regulator n=1 Tax=unclassified Nonomuraea TaxID=2593643 RepID=UPI0033F13F34